MESLNDSNNKRTIALGMPPLPPTSQRMEGQGSENPNIDPQKLKRTLARRRYAKTFRLKQISRMRELEWTVQALEADIERDSAKMYHWKQQHHLGQVENGELKQKLCFFFHEMKFKKAEYVKLMKEKDQLKEVYADQKRYEELMQSNMAYAEFIDMDMDQPGFPTSNFT